MSVCDFCSSPDVRWAYPARNFSQQIREGRQVGGFNSKGGWAACEKCAALIEATDREGLAERSSAAMRERLPGFIAPAHVKILRARIRELHDTFWSSREGPRVPDSPTSTTDPTR